MSDIRRPHDGIPTRRRRTPFRQSFIETWVPVNTRCSTRRRGGRRPPGTDPRPSACSPRDQPRVAMAERSHIFGREFADVIWACSLPSGVALLYRLLLKSKSTSHPTRAMRRAGKAQALARARLHQHVGRHPGGLCVCRERQAKIELMVTPLLHLQQISSKALTCWLQKPAAACPGPAFLAEPLAHRDLVHPHPAACSGPAWVANIRSERGDFGVAVDLLLCNGDG